jgi:hypothetical protein
MWMVVFICERSDSGVGQAFSLSSEGGNTGGRTDGAVVLFVALFPRLLRRKRGISENRVSARLENTLDGRR